MTIPVELLLSFLIPYSVVLIWLVRLESRTSSNTRGVERSDKHNGEGSEVKTDIGVLKSNVVDIKEDIKVMMGMMRNGFKQE